MCMYSLLTCMYAPSIHWGTYAPSTATYVHIQIYYPLTCLHLWFTTDLVACISTHLPLTHLHAFVAHYLLSCKHSMYSCLWKVSKWQLPSYCNSTFEHGCMLAVCLTKIWQFLKIYWCIMYNINIPCAKLFEKKSQFKAFVMRSFSI